MNGYVAQKKSILLVSLLVLAAVKAQPLDQEEHVRKERQLKGTASDADVKMVATNVSPAMATQPMTMTIGMPVNQMALNAVGSQLVRYPNYPGLIYPGIAPGLNGIPGLQANIANTNYPTAYPDPNLPGGLPGGFGGFGPYGYPSPLPPMFGGSLGYPNPQLPNGFVPQPSVDNFQALNNIVNMANAQGLGGGYPAPQPFPVQANMPGLYPPAGGFLERMNMQAYAPGF
ncbi:collagen alpha-5(IV) chain [Drosophila bipectinata]|uniref:collagen alpha-5(IV) chain n=1 Tax=Drosophila bipectinata TaxID=42026 RepID=UPI001C8A4604|nr:galectin-3 [Drosophila bipectinata]